MKTGTFRLQKWITRQDLKDNPKTLYIFGDNMVRKGLGGQAKEMRGEPNAFGIPTKWAPDNKEESFFSDEPMESIIIEKYLFMVEDMLKDGIDVVYPQDGIGTGLSELPERSPLIDRYIKGKVAIFLEKYGPKTA